MASRKWIMSEGGPLIALERELQASWGGICRLTVPARDASNDYERSCEKSEFIESIDLQRGQGLIFGEGPLDTTFWEASDRQIFVVRVIYCDPDFDVDKTMNELGRAIFERPVEKIQFIFFSGNLSIFDSAHDGTYHDIESIETKIYPGFYQISTVLYEPDDRSSLIIHRFGKTDDIS